MLLDHAGGQIGQPDGQAGRAELADEHVAGTGPEPQLAWRPAAGRQPEARLLDQPMLQQLLDPLGDHCSAEAGLTAQLGPGDGRAGTYKVQHGDEGIDLVGGDALGEDRFRLHVAHLSVGRR
jgi:hypothetical protein